MATFSVQVRWHDLTAMHVSIFSQRGVNIADNIARNREPDSFTASGLRKDECVDPNQTALHVYQRAAAVSRIDGSIRLYIDPGIIFAQLTRRGADHTHADGIVHSERAAECQHQFALFDIQRITETQRRQVRGLDFQQSEVEQTILADELRVKLRSLSVVLAVQFDADGASVVDHVRAFGVCADLIKECRVLGALTRAQHGKRHRIVC